MELRLQIMLPEILFIRNPESTELGRKIMKHSVELMFHDGFESFTFKKLAQQIGTTEAGMYRYFENKHQLLMYLTAWYWGWLSYQIKFRTNNITTAKERLAIIITLLSNDIDDDLNTNYINESMMHSIVSKERIRGGDSMENLDKCLSSYIDLCKDVAEIISLCSPNYKYPKALATNLIEISHYHHYLKNNVPALCDYSKNKKQQKTNTYLHEMVFSCLGIDSN